ncbi:MAG: polyketide cyclase [Marmoricola sp.]|nr:polyketide cyclase [Marmoricola sp.]
MKLNVRRTFTTTSSPDVVFAFLADFRTAETWDPGTVSCSLISGEVGPGATYRNVSEFLGRETTLTYATLVHEPATRLHFQGTNDSFTGDDRLGFTPSGSGTEVEYHATFELRGASALAGPVVAAYLPFLAKKTIKQLKATLDALPGRP